MYHTQPLPAPQGPGDSLRFGATFKSFNGSGKDTHGEQFPGDAMSHFCCLCEWEMILKILLFFFFELHQLTIIHFMTWMCVPRLAGSPNLAGKQQNHLESLLEKGGLYSALGKLLLAAG